jgi:hypothetical protein
MLHCGINVDGVEFTRCALVRIGTRDKYQPQCFLPKAFLIRERDAGPFRARNVNSHEEGRWYVTDVLEIDTPAAMQPIKEKGVERHSQCIIWVGNVPAADDDFIIPTLNRHDQLLAWVDHDSTALLVEETDLWFEAKDGRIKPFLFLFTMVWAHKH